MQKCFSYTLPASQFVFHTHAGIVQLHWDLLEGGVLYKTQTVAHQFTIIQIIIVMNLACTLQIHS